MDCLFVVIVYFSDPETKGLALERVGESFGDAIVKVEEDDLSGQGRQYEVNCPKKGQQYLGI